MVNTVEAQSGRETGEVDALVLIAAVEEILSILDAVEFLQPSSYSPEVIFKGVTCRNRP